MQILKTIRLYSWYSVSPHIGDSCNDFTQLRHIPSGVVAKFRNNQLTDVIAGGFEGDLKPIVKALSDCRLCDESMQIIHNHAFMMGSNPFTDQVKAYKQNFDQFVNNQDLQAN